MERTTDGRTTTTTKTIVILCLENLHLHNTIHTTYYIYACESTLSQLFSIIGLRLNRNLYSLFLLSIRKEEAETDDNVLWLCIANGKYSIKLNEIWLCVDGLLSSFSKRIISPWLFNGILWRLFHFLFQETEKETAIKYLHKNVSSLLGIWKFHLYPSIWYWVNVLHFSNWIFGEKFCFLYKIWPSSVKNCIFHLKCMLLSCVHVRIVLIKQPI